MLENSVFLLDLATARKNGGTFYIEITKGIKGNKYWSECWLQDSIYVDGDVWLLFFEFSAGDIIPNYDFYDFINISSDICTEFSNHLLYLSNEVKKCNNLDDFLKSNLCTKSGLPYIQVNAGLLKSFFKLLDDDLNDFKQKVINLSREYQILAHWLMENGKNGVSILGI